MHSPREETSGGLWYQVGPEDQGNYTIRFHAKELAASLGAWASEVREDGRPAWEDWPETGETPVMEELESSARCSDIERVQRSSTEAQFLKEQRTRPGFWEDQKQSWPDCEPLSKAWPWPCPYHLHRHQDDVAPGTETLRGKWDDEVWHI